MAITVMEGFEDIRNGRDNYYKNNRTTGAAARLLYTAPARYEGGRSGTAADNTTQDTMHGYYDGIELGDGASLSMMIKPKARSPVDNIPLGAMHLSPSAHNPLFVPGDGKLYASGWQLNNGLPVVTMNISEISGLEIGDMIRSSIPPMATESSSRNNGMIYDDVNKCYIAAYRLASGSSSTVQRSVVKILKDGASDWTQCTPTNLGGSSHTVTNDAQYQLYPHRFLRHKDGKNWWIVPMITMGFSTGVNSTYLVHLDVETSTLSLFMMHQNVRSPTSLFRTADGQLYMMNVAGIIYRLDEDAQTATNINTTANWMTGDWSAHHFNPETERHIVVNTRGEIFVSDDWFATPPTVHKRTNIVQYSRLVETSQGIHVIGTHDRWLSTDGGTTWTGVYLPMGALHAVEAFKDEVWVVTVDGIGKVYDGFNIELYPYYNNTSNSYRGGLINGIAMNVSGPSFEQSCFGFDMYAATTPAWALRTNQTRTTHWTGNTLAVRPEDFHNWNHCEVSMVKSPILPGRYDCELKWNDEEMVRMGSQGFQFNMEPWTYASVAGSYLGLEDTTARFTPNGGWTSTTAIGSIIGTSNGIAFWPKSKVGRPIMINFMKSTGVHLTASYNNRFYVLAMGTASASWPETGFMTSTDGLTWVPVQGATLPMPASRLNVETRFKVDRQGKWWVSQGQSLMMSANNGKSWATVFEAELPSDHITNFELLDSGVVLMVRYSVARAEYTQYMGNIYAIRITPENEIQVKLLTSTTDIDSLTPYNIAYHPHKWYVDGDSVVIVDNKIYSSIVPNNIRGIYVTKVTLESDLMDSEAHVRIIEGPYINGQIPYVWGYRDAIYTGSAYGQMLEIDMQLETVKVLTNRRCYSIAELPQADGRKSYMVGFDTAVAEMLEIYHTPTEVKIFMLTNYGGGWYDDMVMSSYTAPNAGPQGECRILRHNLVKDVETSWMRKPADLPSNVAAAQTGSPTWPMSQVESNEEDQTDIYETGVAPTVPPGLKPIAVDSSAYFSKEFTTIPEVKSGLGVGNKMIESDNLHLTGSTSSVGRTSVMLNQHPDGKPWKVDNIDDIRLSITKIK